MLVNVLDEENICWGTVWGSDGGVDPRQCQQEPLHCVSERRAQVDHLPLGLEVRVSRSFDHSLYLDGW